MDDYTREMMDLKTLVTRTLEKKGVLAKIRAELRASVFEAIEEEDRVIENEDAVPPALLGSCNDGAKKLHASPSGRILTALVCEYLDWAQLNHALKVYQPECNMQKDSWKAELREFSRKNYYDLNRNGYNCPLLLDSMAPARSNGRSESVPNSERNTRRPSISPTSHIFSLSIRVSHHAPLADIGPQGFRLYSSVRLIRKCNLRKNLDLIICTDF
ncbi:hypothetical protein MKW94_008042 [Papaver nudicaule]|uniref:LisH domain-containing protein n=1 Tax=Papaver nudicaule TaxID=74823 RepID=A0AA42B4P9_PAPNU|nr:hypothetical protein [Papaver nudicaule]